jgi:putative flippase GtrA
VDDYPGRVNSLLRRLTPEARAQGLRYIAVGGLATGVYLASTALLAEFVGLPFQAAMLLGYLLGIAIHFTLHRFFTFATDQGYALGVHRQAGRYVAFVVAQYGVVAVAVAAGASLFGVPEILVWLVLVGPVTVVGFVVLRTRMFHPRVS